MASHQATELVGQTEEAARQPIFLANGGFGDVNLARVCYNARPAVKKRARDRAAQRTGGKPHLLVVVDTLDFARRGIGVDIQCRPHLSKPNRSGNLSASSPIGHQTDVPLMCQWGERRGLDRSCHKYLQVYRQCVCAYERLDTSTNRVK